MAKKNLINLVVFLSPIVFLNVHCSPELAHVKAAHKVMNSFTKKMKKEGLQFYSSGGAMMEDIKIITLGYETCRNLDVDQTRLLFIKESEALLNEINHNEEIRPYLHNYPFTSKNIFFQISFCKEDDDFVDPPYIAYVFLENELNQIVYAIHNESTRSLDTVFTESYEEALRIYNATMQKMALE